MEDNKKEVKETPLSDIDVDDVMPFISKHTMSKAPIHIRHPKKKARRRMARISRRINRR